MTVKLPFPLADAAIGESLSLLVVSKNGSVYEVKMSGDVAAYLAQSWDQTLEALNERDLVAYSPDVVIRAGEDRAVTLAPDVLEDNEVVDIVLADVLHDPVSPTAVPGDLYVYAAVSVTTAGRVAMIKKRNPTKRARSGKRFFLASNELRVLQDDPWELHPLFDFVVSAAGGFALNTTFLEQLFADSDALRAKVTPCVAGIGKHLPMSSESRDLLIARCNASSRLRRRLRAIALRGHLNRVTVAAVRNHVKAMGLNPALYTQGKRLLVSDGTVEELLRILNEDLTTGGLTGDPFRIESKEPLA
jgi:hypothetical protein